MIRLGMMLAFGLILAVTSIDSQGADESAREEFLRAIRAKYDLKEEAFRQHDPLPIAQKFYAPDLISVGPDTVLITGRAQLIEEYKKHIQDGVRIESVYTHFSGDTGWDLANFHVQPADEGVEPYVLKILFLWEKIDGEWWCVADMFTMGELPAEIGFEAAGKP